MEKHWLALFIVKTDLITNSFLSENEKYALTNYLEDAKTHSQTDEEIQLSDERIRQLVENGLGKVLFSVKGLIAKSNRFQTILLEKENNEIELLNLKEKFKKQLAPDQQTKLKFKEIIIPLENLPFSVRAKKILETLQIKSVDDLASLTREKLSKHKKVGVKTTEEIIRRAEEYGIKIK